MLQVVHLWRQNGRATIHCTPKIHSLTSLVISCTRSITFASHLYTRKIERKNAFVSIGKWAADVALLFSKHNNQQAIYINQSPPKKRLNSIKFQLKRRLARNSHQALLNYSLKKKTLLFESPFHDGETILGEIWLPFRQSSSIEICLNRNQLLHAAIISHLTIWHLDVRHPPAPPIALYSNMHAQFPYRI